MIVSKKRTHDVSGAQNDGIGRSRGANIFLLDADMGMERALSKDIKVKLQS